MIWLMLLLLLFNLKKKKKLPSLFFFSGSGAPVLPRIPKSCLFDARAFWPAENMVGYLPGLVDTPRWRTYINNKAFNHMGLQMPLKNIVDSNVFNTYVFLFLNIDLKFITA